MEAQRCVWNLKKSSLGSAWCESAQAQSCSLHPLLLCPSTKSCLGEVAEYMRIGSQPAGNASQGTADSILGRELLSSGLWMWQLGWEWGTLTFELFPQSPGTPGIWPEVFFVLPALDKDTPQE